MEEEEGVDEKDGDKIIIGVGSDVAEIKLRYVESMFFNGDCGGVVRFDDVIRVVRVRAFNCRLSSSGVRGKNST